MISHLDNLSCHYGNYRRLEAQRKWDVTLRKRREIRGIKPEKRLLNMMTGYVTSITAAVSDGAFADKISSLENQMTETQMALCDVYEQVIAVTSATEG